MILVAMGIAAFHYARQNSIDVVWLPLGSCYVLYGLVNGLMQRFGRSEQGLKGIVSGADDAEKPISGPEDPTQSAKTEESL